MKGEHLSYTISYNNVYSMIIDGGNCANISSITLVRKLNLNIIKNHKPYRLQWLNNYSEVKLLVLKSALLLRLYIIILYF